MSPQAKPKPPISEARLAANRRNCKLSSGPKTDIGKSISKLNGVTHGMCCTTPVVLAGEDADEAKAQVESWIVELGAVTAAERTEVLNAVQAQIRVERGRKSEAAALDRIIAAMDDERDDREAVDIEAVIFTLADSPASVIRKLRASTYGLSYLIVQWQLLSDRLTTHQSFEPTQRVRAIHLCGERPTDLFSETAVMQWDLAYLGGIHGNGKLNVVQVMEILLDDKPADMAYGEFERRLELWLPQIPSSIHGHETLTGFVTGMIEELTERLALIKLREERDHALAIEAAKVDTAPDGMRRLRYDWSFANSVSTASK